MQVLCIFAHIRSFVRIFLCVRTSPHARSCPGSFRQCGPQWSGFWWCQCSSASSLWCWNWLSAGWIWPRLGRTHLAPATDRKAKIKHYWRIRGLVETKSKDNHDEKLITVINIRLNVCVKGQQTCMLKMQAILMAHRMPSRHSEATSGSSQSCSPTLNAASKGVHASYNTHKLLAGVHFEYVHIWYFTRCNSLLLWLQ